MISEITHHPNGTSTIQFIDADKLTKFLNSNDKIIKFNNRIYLLSHIGKIKSNYIVRCFIKETTLRELNLDRLLL